jgi:hypothetical protein
MAHRIAGRFHGSDYVVTRCSSSLIGSCLSHFIQRYYCAVILTMVLLSPLLINQTLKAQTCVTVTTSSLPNGTQNSGYTATLMASGGTTPYVWSIGGVLPAGLTLNSTSGIISGTPYFLGMSNFTVSVRDANSNQAQANVSITVVPPPLVITTPTLPGGIENVFYSAPLNATGGIPPYVWSVVGSLPAGLSLGGSTGIISGTPTVGGNYNIAVRVTDTQPVSTTKPYILQLSSQPYIIGNPALSMTQGPPSMAFVINGVNFGATQSGSTVTVGGVGVTTYLGWSSTSITVQVPQGAASGNVVVTVASQPSNGVPFTVTSCRCSQ